MAYAEDSDESEAEHLPAHSVSGVVPARGDLPPDSAPPSTISPRAWRLTPVRTSSIPPPPDEDIARAVLDILLAAAEADGDVCRRETFAIRRLIGDLLGEGPLPKWVEQRITQFDAAQFDLTKTTTILASLSAEQKRHVLELARRVCDANNAYDLEEEQFVLGLVIALGLTKDDVEDLVLNTAPGLNGTAKRLFDIVFSGCFLACSWPLLLGIAGAVKVTSKGPALFAQSRYGKDGREIRVLKFRTMRVQEDGDVVRQACDGDPRITPLGNFLRRTSLDELPQFINVLKGDMSVSGPRPHAIAHNKMYRTQILEYMLRHKVRPGITGWAQVNGWRGETATLDKMVARVACDLEYIRSQTFWMDLRIVWLTIFGKQVRRNAR